MPDTLSPLSVSLIPRCNPMMKTVLCLFLWCASSPAAFAGWISSGGELIRDAQNPWFLENTPSVDYCIQLDAASFSANHAQASEAVRAAIGYWQDQLRAAETLRPKEDPFFARVGTQTFRET